MPKITELTLAGGKIGIERETLRTNAEAGLATTPHPISLGRSYTHPSITIDFAEALLELVTEPRTTPQDAYNELLNLHRYTYGHLADEQLWPVSMPCVLPDDLHHIEIGYFGESNGGRLKRLYRVGLQHRYGMAMQMIAGIHYNYSPPDKLWDELGLTTDSARNAKYMGMLRNIQRFAWLIPYLFGASPVVHESFQPAHGVLTRFDESTLGWRNATSLRMSELGYQNKAQFTVSFNELDAYIYDLATAVMTPAPTFEYLGVQDSQGQYQQISTHILQIANEYYTSARPKQPPKSGELPAIALKNRGIAYVELRLLDVNPYDPCGVSIEQLHFLEVFMLYCLLTDSPPFTHADWNELNSNRLRTACCARDGITLHEYGNARHSQTWAEALLHSMLPIAAQLDAQCYTENYCRSITQQCTYISQNTRLPQRVYHELQQASYLDWAMQLRNAHQCKLQQPCQAEVAKRLDALGTQSRAEFNRIDVERIYEPPFADFLAHYFDPLTALLKQR